jgi:rhodanese-related sulfurtransferase
MLKRLFGSAPSVPEVDVREAQRRMQEENAVLLDVREADELREAAVPGALHIPLGQLSQKGNTLPRDRDLLVFCRSGNRSAMATEMLNKNGFDRAMNVSGGIIAWSQARLPIE